MSERRMTETSVRAPWTPRECPTCGQLAPEATLVCPGCGWPRPELEEELRDRAVATGTALDVLIRQAQRAAPPVPDATLRRFAAVLIGQGRRTSDVEAALVQNGASPAAARAWVDALRSERAVTHRRRGTRHVTLGFSVAALAALLGLGWYLTASAGGALILFVAAFVLGLAEAIYGLATMAQAAE